MGEDDDLLTLAVIGGGILLGLLVIFLICVFCSYFNTQYDRLQRKKRRTSLQAVVIQSTSGASGHHSPSSQKVSSKPLALYSPLVPDHTISVGRAKTEPSLHALTYTKPDQHCQMCASDGRSLAVTSLTNAPSNGNRNVTTMTSVLRHACACTLLMSSSPSERSIPTEEILQLATSTEAVNVMANARTRSQRARTAFLSPMLVHDTDPLIVVSDSTSTNSDMVYTGLPGVTKTVVQINECFEQSTSSCLTSPGEMNFNVSTDNENQNIVPVKRYASPHSNMHYQSVTQSSSTATTPVNHPSEEGSLPYTRKTPHPILHPHFHTQSADEDPTDGQPIPSPLVDSNLSIAQEETESAGGNLEVPDESPSPSPISDITMEDDDDEETSDPCKALWAFRSVLEQKTVATIPQRTLIRLINAESDNETDAAMQLSVEAAMTSKNNQLTPASLLTSLTSFESNTPSEESFDTSNCAKALEAIFDEPSDLPVLATGTSQVSTSSFASTSTTIISTAQQVIIQSTATHLTPPASHRQQRKGTPPKLTSQQKRQSFKKAHRAAASPSPKPAVPVPPVPVMVLPVEVTHLQEAMMTMTEVIRPISPNRLAQMKHDSGYKSQSFDTGSSHAVTPSMQALAMHSYKSVPSLPSHLAGLREHLAYDLNRSEKPEAAWKIALVRVRPSRVSRRPRPSLPSLSYFLRDLDVRTGSCVVFSDQKPAPSSWQHLLGSLFPSGIHTFVWMTGFEAGIETANAGLEVPTCALSVSSVTSSLSDMDVDELLTGSSAFPSLTSSMEVDPPMSMHPSAHKHAGHVPRVPMVQTQPATPTSPQRDWTIDEKSDRLFREFTRPDGTVSKRVPISTATANSLSGTSSNSGRARRAILPKRKSYSPSSSHGGTPAQASIEETEEEQENAGVSSSPSSLSTVKSISADLSMDAASTAGEIEMREPAQPEQNVQLEETKFEVAVPQQPEVFVCSTTEQFLTHLDLRARSPQLRHVPIIKLPDQESDDV